VNRSSRLSLLVIGMEGSANLSESWEELAILVVGHDLRGDSVENSKCQELSNPLLTGLESKDSRS
jgi:hypothetical protein